MSTEQNPIETLAARLQLLPASIRWLYVRQELVAAAALGHEPERGPWSRLADRLVALALRLRIVPLAVAAGNLMLLMGLYVKQSLVRRRPRSGALFVGIGALREADLVRHFGAMQGRAVVYLDERSLDDFFRQSHVRLIALLREMRHVWREVWAHLHRPPSSSGLKREYVLSFLLVNGHSYAYLRAWFRQRVSAGGDLTGVAWTTTSLLAYAPIAVGLDVTHMEHGFQRHSLIYPDFARSVCFNAFDAAHIRRRLPHCKVTVSPEPFRPVATRRVVAVAGIFWEPDDFDLIRPYVEWALRNDLPVVVRKHPFDRSDYWDQWHGVAGIEISNRRESFLQFLERERPRMLATWYSTAIFDCITKGIVPVTVTPRNHEAALDMVFPFREQSLCWPEQEGIAQAVLDDEKRRTDLILEYYARATTVATTTTPVELEAAQQA